MKYIEKDFTSLNVKKYNAELMHNRLDKESLSDCTVHPTMKGADVYEAIKSFESFENLKKQLEADQGGICCYCGQKLIFSKHPPYIIEHVVPKGRCRQLGGEYGNLLLSCGPKDDEYNQKKLNEENKKIWHCDKSKGDKVLTYTPLQEDCLSHFKYLESGIVEGDDDLAQKDIDILGLNCNYLQTRRKQAIDATLYDENGMLLSDEILEKYLKVIMNRRSDNTFQEFCFVIAGAIENLLYNR